MSDSKHYTTQEYHAHKLIVDYFLSIVFPLCFDGVDCVPILARVMFHAS